MPQTPDAGKFRQWLPTPDFRSYRLDLATRQRRGMLSMQTQPELGYDRLSVKILIGDERKNAGLLSAGDFSLAITYKSHKSPREEFAYIASFDGSTEDLRLLQLQGVGRRALRVASGLNSERLIAEHAVALVSHPESPWKRLVMPHPYDMSGIEGAMSEHAMGRYMEFAEYSGLRFSSSDNHYARQVK